MHKHIIFLDLDSCDVHSGHKFLLIFVHFFYSVELIPLENWSPGCLMCRVVGLKLFPPLIHRHWTARSVDTYTDTPNRKYTHTHTVWYTASLTLEMANFCSTRTVENGGHRKQAKTLLSYLTFAKNARTHPQAGSVCSTLRHAHIPTPVHFTFVAVAYLCTFFFFLYANAPVCVHTLARSYALSPTHTVLWRRKSEEFSLFSRTLCETFPPKCKTLSQRDVTSRFAYPSARTLNPPWHTTLFLLLVYLLRTLHRGKKPNFTRAAAGTQK